MFSMEFEVDGAGLNIEVDGPVDAPAVLFWNGAGCTLHMWDMIVPKLVDRFRLIRFDVRGTGASTPTEVPETQYTFEQYADDANRILDAHNVDRCHVWSMAWGTRAAIAYCSLNPERVISAALYDASIGRADVEAQRRGGRRARELQVEAGIGPFPIPDGWNVHQTPEAVPEALAAAARADLRKAVHHLDIPVLVATGDHDPNLDSSRELVSMVPGAHLIVFENVGHGSVLQRPDLAAETYLEFQDSIV
jgi:3-oxoadipate enol-lactonase